MQHTLTSLIKSADFFIPAGVGYTPAPAATPAGPRSAFGVSVGPSRQVSRVEDFLRRTAPHLRDNSGMASQLQFGNVADPLPFSIGAGSLNRNQLALNPSMAAQAQGNFSDSLFHPEGSRAVTALNRIQEQALAEALGVNYIPSRVGRAFNDPMGYGGPKAENIQALEALGGLSVGSERLSPINTTMRTPSDVRLPGDLGNLQEQLDSMRAPDETAGTARLPYIGKTQRTRGPVAAEIQENGNAEMDAIHARMDLAKSKAQQSRIDSAMSDPATGYSKPMSSMQDYEDTKGFDWSRLLGPGVGALGGLAAGRLASGFMDDDEDVEDPRERARIRAANQRRKLMLGLLGAGVGGVGGHYLQNG